MNDLIRVLQPLLEPLNLSIPVPSQVALVALDGETPRVVASQGSVSGALTLPLERMLPRREADGSWRSTTAVPQRVGDQEVRVTATVLADADGFPAAALCIACDVSLWDQLSRISEAYLSSAGFVRPEPVGRDLDELAQGLLDEVLADVDVPPELMQKKHKVAVVSQLRERGYFQLKDAVEQAAKALHVTRFTIYNYLNELDGEA